MSPYLTVGLLILGPVAVVVAIYSLSFALIPKCPACGKKTLRWDEPMKSDSSRPRARAQDNRYSCAACGHVLKVNNARA